MGEHLIERGSLRGHGGWVTSIATTPESPDVVLSSSRDKSVIVWHLTRDEEKYGFAYKRLKGHSHYVQDVTVSSDGQFALSGSWDSTLRLWDINTGATTQRFVGHTKDVLSVAFSADNRQIISGSRDRTINLWNTLGHCKYSITEDGHKDWVSSVRFSPNLENPLVVSGGWDKVVKVWSLKHFKLKSNFLGHTGCVNTVTVSPDGSLCASGGKDGVAMLWDLNEGRHLSTLEAADTIHALAFSPIRYWLCAATTSGIRIWDLESKQCVADLKPDIPPRERANPERRPKAVPIQCISLAWSSDGSTLFAGYTDNVIRVWSVGASA